ncbi:hypothetical protein BDB00DRAFT_793319 [Zychaea mexicana]|uniref:uncharacterized protein n=1 Tax=Zychaea mexicana TaxID=64656 RepID=UPI0022FF1141|nr:uncharacterized protein BDB00DRAFT_793319 [Zychaea mexicana]KAI9477119.1 hypothetical protein BDB00DRAFT_793319 [Zychaea mexicana]
MIFNKYVTSNNIQNFSKAQPDWYELLRTRKKIVDYLTNNKSPTITLCSDTEKWVINGEPITEQLIGYREESIDKASNGKLTSIHEELLQEKTLQNASQLLSSFPTICSDIMKELSVHYEVSLKMESSFTLDAIDPVLLPFFKETDLIMRKGTDGQVTGSKARRGKVGRFVDLSMVFEFAGMPEQTLVFVEIKAPSKVADGSRPDFIKMANEMKGSIDNFIEEGFDDDEIFATGI